MIIGRFAPTPSGALHMGSLVAAMASYLAVPADGVWLLRIDDIDAPRVVPGSADRIIRQLDTFGFQWHGEIVWQSRRLERYRSALDQLRQQGLVYACECSRKTLTGVAETGPQGIIYPGLCANKNLPEPGNALRLRVTDKALCFDDACVGRICENLNKTTGDFIVQRRDGVISYHLATVVDDADAGVNQVVRGADLLGSTARQIRLQHLLGLPVPDYAHIPLVVNAQGRKLSKQNLAPELDESRPLPLLLDAWRLLGQSPLTQGPDDVASFWVLARSAFDLSRAAAKQQQYD
ncbi:MAG: tRNA glutamyl-Q(34) synthetase GluQRS [Gammaproteobacteria bacterium]|nr:MAG: tRNA glutamyl-Q(34) synthetase GluQRS [Gammaproteobacteria bacterium]RTZ59777.1 MAG: tRNA glutamyl-Q(34) synthetase GluQRS [Gammaproteobacteria bacterium]